MEAIFAPVKAPAGFRTKPATACRASMPDPEGIPFAADLV